MSEVQLPEQIKGPWDHLLILTYGMDLPFFEHTLLRELPARCRNRIVLGDGAHLLEISEAHVRDGLARAMNHRYVAEGIFSPQAAHAKLIMLTNPTQGRLLVGSGNLSWQGYASGGELFTTYQYQAEAPQQLGAFLAVRDLLEGLMLRRYLSDAAERYLQLLLQGTPWLHQSPEATDRPVRHNLNQSFLQQLRLEVGEQPVEELIILSPFYDRECRALEQLLILLQPAELTLLVQPGRTSLDPVALQRVLAGYRGTARVQVARRPDGEPYLHAKLILVKQRDRAVCLQGSANLSQAALLLIDPQGNIELVNLLSGARDAFDDLLAGLAIDPALVEVQNLDLHYEEPEQLLSAPAAWRLTAAAWDGTQLRIEDRGPRPDLSGAVAILGVDEHRIERPRVDVRAVAWKPPVEEARRFDRPVALRIRLVDGSQSNPVFICNTAALDAALAVTAEDASLSQVGGLDLDDHEIETLFGLIDSTLLIDRRSLWQVAGKQASVADMEAGDAQHLSYDDIDYALLRQHPRVQQYLRGFGVARAGRTRLQVILSSISGHLLEILDRTSQGPIAGPGAAVIGSTDLSEEELEAADEPAAPQGMRSPQQRTQRLLKSFINRYLEGITSAEFRALVGVEVLAQNYIIFSHILWRLWVKDWLDYNFMVDAFTRTWHAFWGDADDPGCLTTASTESRDQIGTILREHHTVATLLASLFDSARWMHTWGWHAQRLALRDFWRVLLTRHAGLITTEVLEQTWHALADAYPQTTPLPAEIVADLAELADFETSGSFLRALESRHGFPAGSCQFERVEVYREPLDRTAPVNCLVIAVHNALRSADEAVSLVGEWMRFQPLDYYRIVAPTSHKAERVVLYEVREHEGLLWDSLTKRETILGRIDSEPQSWAEALAQLQALAEQVQARLEVPQIVSTKAEVR
ncbi:hypothetical protein [Candidatus Viridilinea mediisalina]|uniref:PLD phosphodiesterase domain-containing protein n=1 Tax=Candidatus Viridilinea mediisalina TaxID=2024553 RepID=A0A2A6RQ90_9CHLR|nr:hypothetical protein [Candidatus Viridilinea mediisalina]PDW05101.1 hypothetical protein CJ255_00470 [Candidatus Viridilinea mediisalina]